MRECFKDVKDGYLLIYDFLSHLSHRRSITTVQTRFEKNLQDTMEAVTLSVEPSKLVRPDVFASTSSSVLLVDCQEKKKKNLPRVEFELYLQTKGVNKPWRCFITHQRSAGLIFLWGNQCHHSWWPSETGVALQSRHKQAEGGSQSVGWSYILRHRGNDWR